MMVVKVLLAVVVEEQALGMVALEGEQVAEVVV